MHENRTSYPERKTRMYQQLQELPKRYSVLAIIKMDKVRSAQILPLRKALKDKVEFVNIKCKVAQKALGNLDMPGIRDMIGELSGQCTLMFTDMSPFKLNVLLAKNRIMMIARGGDISSIDVIVSAKNTGIAPGPMLTEFKDAGIPTKIDQGTIWIAKDTTPVLKGEVIPGKLAAILGKLDIKSVQAGISLYTALEDGTKYAKEEMIVDVEEIIKEITLAHEEAMSLSVEATYVTVDNILQILGKASQAACSVSVNSGFLTDETREQILQKANAHAKALVSQAKDYTSS